MKAATSVEEVAPHFLFWSAYSAEVKCDLCSAAYRSEEGWVLIDPIALTPKAWTEAFGITTPIAIFLTNGNHARAAAEIREKRGIPIHASAGAEAELGIPVDHAFSEEETVLHGLRVVPIPGATEGETAFLAPEGILFLGDAVINLESEGLALLPKKYCQDEKKNRASLKKLLDYEFSIVSFAHGTPLRTNAKERLRQLL